MGLFFVLVTLAFCLIEGKAAATTPRPSALKNRTLQFTPVPRLAECAWWHESSGIDVVSEPALHREMCDFHAAPAPPPPPAAVVEDQEGVQAIAEAVLEVLPTSQHNFALDRDGAKVLAFNPGAKKVAAILDDDGDTFMRNDCRDDKWVVLELSQVAKVSRIELGQYELYSSRVKEFEVRGRQSHPRTDNVDTAKGLNSTAWRVLGKFTAEKAKGVQQFAFEQPAWVRYLLLRLLTHYGTEPVCAINGVAVYGKSAAEELEDQLAGDEMGLEMEAGAVEEALAAVNVNTQNSAGAGDNAGAAAGPQGQAAEQQQEQQQAQAAGSGFGATEERPLGVPDSGAGSGDDRSSGGGEQEKSGKGADAPSRAATGSLQQQRVPEPAAATPASATTPASGSPQAQAPVPPVQRPAEDARSPPGGAYSSENGAVANAPPLPPPIEALPAVKGKSGGGVFDVLVQEILTVKAQQRMATKALESLQRNFTSVATAAGTGAGPCSENPDFAALEAKLDAMVAAKLRAVEAHVGRLQVALERAAKREHAVLCLLGMLGGVLALTLPIKILGNGKKWQGVRVAVGVLAAANGVVSLLLAAKGSAAAHGALAPTHFVGTSPAAPPLPQA